MAASLLKGLLGKKQYRLVKEPKGYHCHREEKAKQFMALQFKFSSGVSGKSPGSPCLVMAPAVMS